MSQAVEDLLSSNVMDRRFNLPLVSVHRNPHIYCADVIRTLEALGPEEKDYANTVRLRYRDTFLEDCEIANGLITTYPGEESASHDDLLGACILNSEEFQGSNSFAERAVIYLTKKDGSYIFNEEDSERHNIFRFLFLLPTLKSLAGFRVNFLLSQVAYSLHLLFHLWTTKPHDMSGHNKIWLTIPTMMKHPLSRAAIEYWAQKQTEKGFTPKTMFETHYLTECPWFAKWATDDWLK